MCIGDAALLFGLFQDNLRLSNRYMLDTHGHFGLPKFCFTIPQIFATFAKCRIKQHPIIILCIKFDFLHSSL